MSNSKCFLPCTTCPWRTANKDAAAIPGYVHEKAVNLLNTVGPDDGFRPVMACHGSTDESPKACRGYLAREGWRNLNVRMMLMKKRIESPSEVADACEEHGVELEPDYPTVLRKLAASLKRRRRAHGEDVPGSEVSRG